MFRARWSRSVSVTPQASPASRSPPRCGLRRMRANARTVLTAIDEAIGCVNGTRRGVGLPHKTAKGSGPQAPQPLIPARRVAPTPSPHSQLCCEEPVICSNRCAPRLGTRVAMKRRGSRERSFAARRKLRPNYGITHRWGGSANRRPAASATPTAPPLGATTRPGLALQIKQPPRRSALASRCWRGRTRPAELDDHRSAAPPTRPEPQLAMKISEGPLPTVFSGTWTARLVIACVAISTGS